MEITHNYSCNRTQAYEIVDNVLADLQKQYGDMIQNPSKKWNEQHDQMDFSFKAKGLKVSGNIRLGDHSLTLTGSLPWLARPFEGSIRSAIQGKLEEVLV